VFVHELGHFLVAKASGIRVDEFAIGFPPRLVSKKVGETIYSLNLVPFGGYVKIFGENPDTESLSGPDSKRSFVNKNRMVQAAVLVAGITFNFLFAWLLLSAGYFFGSPVPLEGYEKYTLTDKHTIIISVLPESPAAEAGLKLEDSILFLERGTTRLERPLAEEVEKFVAEGGTQEITLGYERAREAQTIKIKPEGGFVEGKAIIGVSLASIGTLKVGFPHAFIEGTKTTWYVTRATAVGLWSFFSQAFQGQADFSSVTGPVGIANLVGEASRQGFIYLLSFTAIISLNLAIINFLPFPALDGGRLLFVAIEAVIRRRIKPQIQNVVNSVGFAILITLMLVVTWKDIAKFF
jgi:regulator of sigma E protease